MSHPFEHVSWQETILGVRRPLQFFALALTIPALPLSTMLLNETIVSTLGRDGLLLLSTITAAVQVFALVPGDLHRLPPAGGGDRERSSAGRSPAVQTP